MSVDLVPKDERTTTERVVPGLRFIERKIYEPVPGFEHTKQARMLRILQERWEITHLQGDFAYKVTQEWRDVPLVTEGA